ncbi:MAG TPA: hypothetical protein VF158_12010 [Longimicrobiales bacterium]
MPVASATPIMVGGALCARVEREAANAGETVDEQREAGIFFSSGLVGGAAPSGVVLAPAMCFRGAGAPSGAAAWVAGHAWVRGLPTPFGTRARTAWSWILHRAARRRRVW